MNRYHHSVSTVAIAKGSFRDNNVANPVHKNLIGCADEQYHTGSQPLQYYPLANNISSTLFIVSHDINVSSSWTLSITAGVIRSGYLSSSLSVNGSRLASDASKFNIAQTARESGVLTQVINFQYNFSDAGFYVHYLYFSDPYFLASSIGHRCFDHYDYADLYLHLHPTSFIIFPFILTTYVYSEYIEVLPLICSALNFLPTCRTSYSDKYF